MIDKIIEEETSKKINTMESEFLEMKYNCERLQSLYREAKDESQRIRNEYETKINQMNDKVADVIAENTILKDRNEVLYQLSKGYLALTEANNRNKDSEKGSSGRKNDDDVLVLGTVMRQNEKEPERQPTETWNVTKP